MLLKQITKSESLSKLSDRRYRAMIVQYYWPALEYNDFVTNMLSGFLKFQKHIWFRNLWKGKITQSCIFYNEITREVRQEAFYLKSSKKGQNLKFQSINFFLTCIFSVLREKRIKNTAEKLNKKIQITVFSDKYSRLLKNAYSCSSRERPKCQRLIIVFKEISRKKTMKEIVNHFYLQDEHVP